MSKTIEVKEQKKVMSQDELKEYLIGHIEDEFQNILKIAETYAKFDVYDYEMDLQIYTDKQGNQRCEPRIWLTSEKVRMGINLSLYSINLDWVDSQLDNELAFDVFSEYQKYYTMNSELFKVERKYGGETSVNIIFEISKREW